MRSVIALAALVLALAVPTAALAQGAGDDQYEDPFGSGQEQQQEPTSQATPAPTQAPAQPSQAAPAAPPPAAPAAPPAAAPTAPAAGAAGPDQLPYTGANAGLPALAGALLLCAGVALRLRVRADGER